MAVPKRRTSKAAKRKRRTHKKLKPANIVLDQLTGEYRRNHHVSPDGYYKGEKVR